MKKWILISVVLIVLASIGNAFGTETGTPQQVQSVFAQQGVKANYFMWFPIVPQDSKNGWSNILIISNFNDFPITVYAWFTSFSQEQTMKEYSLDFYEKKIIVLGGNSGFGDDMYDIYCASDNFFGAEVLLIEGGLVAAAWPPIYGTLAE